MKKNVQFEQHAIDVASVAKELGHPARVTVLKFLIENDNQTVKELVEKLPFSQSTVSQHLQRLKSVGLLDAKYHKTSTIYSINKETLRRFQLAVEKVLGSEKYKRQMSLC